MARKTFLVVDDEPEARRLLVRYFTGKGVRVVTACDGREALAFLKTELPDLILLDVNMPGLGGLETLRLLKEAGLAVPVVMISGAEDVETARKAVSLGARDFLKKPLDLDYLDASPTLKAWLEGPVPSAQAGAKTFLVVDDEPAIRRVLSRYFAAKGIRVVTASNGKEALELLRTERPRLMLLDIRMPVMDGLEVLEALNREGLKFPVIMISATDDVETARRAMALGARDYIRKPIDLDYLETSSSVLAWLGEP